MKVSFSTQEGHSHSRQVEGCYSQALVTNERNICGDFCYCFEPFCKNVSTIYDSKEKLLRYLCFHGLSACDRKIENRSVIVSKQLKTRWRLNILFWSLRLRHFPDFSIFTRLLRNKEKSHVVLHVCHLKIKLLQLLLQTDLWTYKQLG